MAAAAMVSGRRTAFSDGLPARPAAYSLGHPAGAEYCAGRKTRPVAPDAETAKIRRRGYAARAVAARAVVPAQAAARFLAAFGAGRTEHAAGNRRPVYPAKCLARRRLGGEKRRRLPAAENRFEQPAGRSRRGFSAQARRGNPLRRKGRAAGNPARRARAGKRAGFRCRHTGRRTLSCRRPDAV